MKLSIVSPVHIGNGRELTVVDFVPLNERMIAVLDLEKLLEELMQINADVDEVLEALRNPETLPDEYIWKHFLDKYGVEVEDVRKYTLPVVGKPGNRSMRIREFIKVRGKPYIPGSSVKGAIRTAVFCHVAREHYNELSGLLDKLAERGAKKTKADDRLEAEVFGYREQYRNGRKSRVYEPKNDPMRALIVRDSGPFGLKHLRLYSVSTVGGKRDIPQYVEGVENLQVEIEIKVDKELIDRGLREGNLNGLLADTISSGEEFENLIWEAVDEFAEEVISFEKKNIDRYGWNFKGKVNEFYKQLEKIGGHKLRIGWGSGWYSMTLGPLLVNHPMFQEIRRKLKIGKPYQSFPKTRRVANSKPMAWVVLNE